MRQKAVRLVCQVVEQSVCVYLTAFNDCLGDQHTDLHVSVVLRPAVVFSHCPVVTVRVRLKLTLTPETQTDVYRYLLSKRYI